MLHPFVPEYGSYSKNVNPWLSSIINTVHKAAQRSRPAPFPSPKMRESHALCVNITLPASLKHLGGHGACFPGPL
jgi:hypothetical protein